MDDNEIHDVDDQLEPAPQPVMEGASEGIPWGAGLLLIWAILLVIFSVQNADTAPVSFLGWSWEMPVALLVMVTALVTLVLAILGSAFYRRRRRRRAELKRTSRSKD